MNTRCRIARVGHATSVFLAVTFVLCVSFGLLFPVYRMYEAWAPLLPGFEWLTLGGFIFGLIGSYLYGWYIAILWVPLFNLFGRRDGISGSDRS
jgi:2TM family of unknown function (DUF5676)